MRLRGGREHGCPQLKTVLGGGVGAGAGRSGEVRMSQDDAGETSPGQILGFERPPQPDSPLDPKGCRREPVRSALLLWREVENVSE